MFSDVVQNELKLSPQHVQDFATRVKSLPIQFIETSAEAEDLANEYITQKVVGQTSYEDCMHIALATIHHADCLVSWNFKHIVNLPRIKGYSIINLTNGYHTPEIRSPKELVL